MQHNYEYETYERLGVEPPRSYYLNFEGVDCFFLRIY